METTPNGTLLICTPWDQPTTLTRSWCLWEIFCSTSKAARGGCKVRCVLRGVLFVIVPFPLGTYTSSRRIVVLQVVIPRREAELMIRGLNEDKTLERISFALTHIQARTVELHLDCA